jgi:hypothetical protein
MIAKVCLRQPLYLGATALTAGGSLVGDSSETNCSSVSVIASCRAWR